MTREAPARHSGRDHGAQSGGARLLGVAREVAEGIGRREAWVLLLDLGQHVDCDEALDGGGHVGQLAVHDVAQYGGADEEGEELLCEVKAIGR